MYKSNLSKTPKITPTKPNVKNENQHTRLNLRINSFSLSISRKNIIEIKVINFKDRKVSVTADNIEFRNIKEVTIQSSQDKNCKILFDNNHSIEDKILNEQFEY